MPLKIHHLSKTHGGANNDIKYFVDCRDIDPIKHLEVERHIPSSDAKVMKVAVKEYSQLGMRNKKLVIKLSSKKQTNDEYKISEFLHRCGLTGFMKFLCMFECDDDLDDKETLCQGSTKDMKSAIVMPFFPSGSLANYKFESLEQAQVFMMNVIDMLGNAFLKTGYLHNDIHEGNFIVSNKNLPIITDFVRSRFVDTKQKDTHHFFWMDILGLSRFVFKSRNSQTIYRVKNPTNVLGKLGTHQTVSEKSLDVVKSLFILEECANPTFLDLETLIKMRDMDI